MRLRSVVFLVLMVAAFSTLADGAGLSFDAARTQMRSRSDQLRGASAAVEFAQQESNALSGLDYPRVVLNLGQVIGQKRVELPVVLPGVDVGSVHTQPINLGNVPIGESINGPRASILGSYVIYAGGRIAAKQAAAAAAVDEVRAGAEAEADLLDDELARLYFGVQLARSVDHLRGRMLAQQDEELARAVEFEKQGMISQLERLAVQVARDAAAREHVKAQADVRIAELRLSRMLRQEKLPPLTTPLFVVTRPLAPLAEWQGAALQANPIFAIIKAKQTQAEQAQKASVGAWLPEVFAFGQYNFVKSYLALPEPDWVVGIGVNFTLVDNLDRPSGMAAADALVARVDAARADATNRVATGIEVAWRLSQEAAEQYRLTASGVSLAKENLRLREKSFAEGLSTAVDVNEARTMLMLAETGRRLAAFEFDLAYAALHAASGRMNEFAAQARGPDVAVEP